MVKKTPVQYSIVDAFTESPFKGNPAAVCLLEEERDDQWLQSVASEFNIPITCFLMKSVDESENPRFRLRWFTPIIEVKLCGHGTLAAAHSLFKSGVVLTNAIEFNTLSGILTANKVLGVGKFDSSKSSSDHMEDYFIELDFPTVEVFECAPLEIPSIPGTLNDVLVINMKRTATEDIIVELSSSEAVAVLQPQFDEIQKCSARAVIVTGLTPAGSGFDFFSRVFCPKFGINEDHVCGSAHCALAPYWSNKLGKHDLKAYMASPRGGILDLHLDEENQRLLIRGKAVTVMEGAILV